MAIGTTASAPDRVLKLFMNGPLPHRLRPACWPEGAEDSGRHAQEDGVNQTLCAGIDGFSLHAAVRAGYEHVFNTIKLNVGFAVTLAGVAVAVATGDIVAADQDGVVVVPFDRIDAVGRGWRSCARPKPGWTPRCVRG